MVAGSCDHGAWVASSWCSGSTPPTARRTIGDRRAPTRFSSESARAHRASRRGRVSRLPRDFSTRVICTSPRDANTSSTDCSRLREKLAPRPSSSVATSWIDATGCPCSHWPSLSCVGLPESSPYPAITIAWSVSSASAMRSPRPVERGCRAVRRHRQRVCACAARRGSSTDRPVRTCCVGTTPRYFRSPTARDSPSCSPDICTGARSCSGGAGNACSPARGSTASTGSVSIPRARRCSSAAASPTRCRCGSNCPREVLVLDLTVTACRGRSARRCHPRCPPCRPGRS